KIPYGCGDSGKISSTLSRAFATSYGLSVRLWESVRQEAPRSRCARCRLLNLWRFCGRDLTHTSKRAASAADHHSRDERQRSRQESRVRGHDDPRLGRARTHRDETNRRRVMDWAWVSL